MCAFSLFYPFFLLWLSFNIWSHYRKSICVLNDNTIRLKTRANSQHFKSLCKKQKCYYKRRYRKDGRRKKKNTIDQIPIWKYNIWKILTKRYHQHFFSTFCVGCFWQKKKHAMSIVAYNVDFTTICQLKRISVLFIRRNKK